MDPLPRLWHAARFCANTQARTAAGCEAVVLRMKVERQEVLSRGGEHAQAPAQTAAFLEQLCGDMEAVLVNTNAGVDESRSLLPHLKAFADVVAGSGCQPAIPGVPTSRPETLGFADLPTDIQRKVLTLHLDSQLQRGSRRRWQGVASVKSVCRSFDAHVYIHRHARQKVIIRNSIKAAALLPYSPSIHTLVCNGQPQFRACNWDAVRSAYDCFAHRILASPQFPMPQLVSLTLQKQTLVNIPMLLAALTPHTQLTTLLMSFHYQGLPEEPRSEPAPQLPSLPMLQQLSLEQPLLTYPTAPTPPILLGNLSDLRRLTSLHLVLSSVEREQLVSFGPETDTAHAMQPVCEALASLSELSELRLSCLPCGGPAAEACWSALARALPLQQHLTSLDLLSILVPEEDLEEEDGFNAACLTALASGLWQRTALRSLTLTGLSHDDPNSLRWDHGNEYRGASVQLARAIGSLTSLTQLMLRDLDEVLGLDDCCSHLRHLSSLCSLELPLVDAGTLPGGEPSYGAAVDDLLSGMTQLTSLHLDYYPDEEGSFRGGGGAALLRTALSALPQLVGLYRLGVQVWMFGEVDVDMAQWSEVAGIFQSRLYADDVSLLCVRCSCTHMTEEQIESLNELVGEEVFFE